MTRNMETLANCGCLPALEKFCAGNDELKAALPAGK